MLDNKKNKNKIDHYIIISLIIIIALGIVIVNALSKITFS